MMPIIQIILSHIIQRSENQVCQTDCIRTRGVMKLLCTNLLKLLPVLRIEKEEDMDNKLITDLSRVFDYRYVDENEYNFKLISDMLTDFNFSLEYHRNKEVFAHNGEQIKYEHLNVTSSVSDF